MRAGGGDLALLHPPIAWGEGIKNHLYARGDSFLIWGFSEGWEVWGGFSAEVANPKCSSGF